jgi:O-antigen/teichoic acid export membrane protein
MDSTLQARPAAARPPRDDVFVAARNALTLGTSLLVTWSIALLVRFFLPRYLGPQHFGTLSFADSFAGTFFILLGLGGETYIQREIPVRREHASDFFGGFIALRLAMSALLFAAMAVVMARTHRAPEAQRVVFVFGGMQFFTVLNGELAALLHASCTVDELAVVNVVVKVLWAALVGGAIVARLGLAEMAIAFLIVEVLRTALLVPLARRHLGIRLRWSSSAVKMVIVASLPFYLAQVANTVYSKVAVSMLSVLSNDTEVGWYGAAFNVAGLSFLVSPLIGWVLLPLLSRARARSEAEMFAILRRALTAVLLLVIPVALLLGVGADVWVRCLFGAAFLPATLGLRILAPMFVLTYVATIAWTCLILLRRAWTVAAVAVFGLAVNPVLNAAIVPRALRWLGPGGACAGAATALVVTELCVTAALLGAIGPRTFDRPSAAALGKALGCCLLVIGADALLRPLGFARLAIDAALYASLFFALGGARLEDVKQLSQLLLRRRHRDANS